MKKYSVLFLLALPFSAFALESKADNSGDWQYICDNTGTCRIAGYQEKDNLQAISLLFTREAGLDAPTTAEIALLPENEVAIPEKVTLEIGGKVQGELAIDKESGRGTLDEAAIKAVIEALRDHGDKAEIRVRGGDLQWQLSAKGAGAMWFGAESFQKRIGTPSSWMSPGDRTEGLLEAVAKPVIKTAPVSQEAARVVKPGEGDYDRLRALLAETERKARAADDVACERFDAEGVKAMQNPDELLDIQVYKLDEQHKLLSAMCGSGAYNTLEVFAWTDAQMGKVIDGLRVFTGGEGYREGRIYEFSAARGASDCAFYASHVWTGETFVRAFAAETGLCSNFPGGAWELPIWVSEVVEP
ncbi:MAG: DUF1176 domain-containing protein [Cardiobacteriaceae bacterium]|nr:DUF1176 domain-containing protein [Cardiobacteriaceae bacterium]